MFSEIVYDVIVYDVIVYDVILCHCRATQEAQKIFPAKHPIDKEPTSAKVGGVAY